MIKTPEQITAANQAALETAMKLAQISMENGERLVRLQLDTAKELLEGNLKNARALAEVKDPQQLAELRTRALESGVEQMTNYSRDIYELAAKTQSEFGKIMEGRLSAFTSGVEKMVDETAKSAPAGAEPAIAAMKQTLTATNAMMDSMTKAAKQFTKAADSNLKSAASAAKTGAKKRA